MSAVSAGKAGNSVIIQDITDRRNAEDALHRAYEQRRLTLEAAEMGAWDYRFETGEVYWDQRCRQMWGVADCDRIAYDAALDLIHPEDLPAVEAAVRRALDGAGDGVYRQEFRVVWPDGTLRWVASHGRVFFRSEDGQRRAVRFIGANRDITRRGKRSSSWDGSPLGRRSSWPESSSWLLSRSPWATPTDESEPFQPGLRAGDRLHCGGAAHHRLVEGAHAAGVACGRTGEAGGIAADRPGGYLPEGVHPEGRIPRPDRGLGRSGVRFRGSCSLLLRFHNGHHRAQADRSRKPEEPGASRDPGLHRGRPAAGQRPARTRVVHLPPGHGAPRVRGVLQLSLRRYGRPPVPERQPR